MFDSWIGKILLEKKMKVHSSIVCLEDSMNRGAWQATVHEVSKIGQSLVTKPPTTMCQGRTESK